MRVAALLDREIQALPIRRPPRRSVSIVERLSHFMTTGSVGIHHPQMRVLHRRLRRGERTRRPEIREALPVGGPYGPVLSVLRSSELRHRSISDGEREDVVVEGAIGIWLVVRDEY